VREFIVEITTTVPEGTDPAEVERRRAAEAVRARELADAGHLVRLWRPVGQTRSIGVWRAADETELDEGVLGTLPLRPWMTLRVTAVDPHPNDPGRPAAADGGGTAGGSTFSGVAHVAVVVRDMAISVEWYRRVLGFEPTGAVTPGPAEAGHPRLIMRHAASGLVLAVHEPLHRSGDSFDPSRTGLDHFSLAVSGRAALDDWARRLDDLGVAHSPVRDTGYAQFVTLADPDGIAWELWAAAAPDSPGNA
jgi:glyoxylase I family protein